MTWDRRTSLWFVFWIVVIVSGTLLFARQWNQVGIAESLPFRQKWIAAAGIGLALLHSLLALGWTAILRGLGGTIRPSAAADAYILALLPKYLPGRIFGHGVRIRLATMAGVPIGIATGAVLIEGAFAVASAVGIAAVGYLIGDLERTEGTRSLLLILLGIGAILGIAAFRGKLPGKRWKELSGVSQISEHPLKFILYLMLYVIAWLIFGAVNWLLANAITPIEGNLWFDITVAGAVASGIGFVAVFAPAGIGIREGLFYAFARGWMSSAHALVFVALSRLVALAAEIIITAAWVVIIRRRVGIAAQARAP